jgi:hypothetical protein
VRIPRSLRDLQVERESLFLDFSSQRLFHGLDLFFAQRRQQFSFRAVLSDAMSRDHEGQCHVQMLMDDRLASGQSVAPVGALQLHHQVVNLRRNLPKYLEPRRALKLVLTRDTEPNVVVSNSPIGRQVSQDVLWAF